MHVDLPPIQTPPPPVTEPLRDYVLEDNLIEVNRLIHETLKKMEKLKHRRNVTNVVREEAVKRRARELGIRLRNYTVHALFDAGHDVGDRRLFFRTYLEDYNDDIDRQYEELSTELKELEHEKSLIIDDLINF